MNSRDPTEALARPQRDLRTGPVMLVPALLREFGIDPAPVLARAGIGPQLLEAAENRVSSIAVGQLLDDSARATGCAHFGLLVGQRFGLHERQLRRLLTAEGTSFRELANEARREVAQHLLRDTRLPLPEFAATLHYADATALSRAFTQWTGVAPGTWRAANSSHVAAAGALPG